MMTAVKRPVPGPALVDTLWPSNERTRWLRMGALVIGGSLLMILASKIQIPFWPVPLTLQTLAVLTLGMAYGPRLAFATLMLYMAEGAVGLPVFSGTPEKGIGLAYMMGTTGGYLLGFVMAATLVGWFAERGWDRNFISTAAAMLIGNVVIYVPGLLWLGAVVGWDKPVLEWGLYPFLAGDGVKLLLAAIAMPVVWKVTKKLRG
ncbi:MAG: biotin transporter BioY [Magnetospiraceae bacterium]